MPFKAFNEKDLFKNINEANYTFDSNILNSFELVNLI